MLEEVLAFHRLYLRVSAAVFPHSDTRYHSTAMTKVQALESEVQNLTSEELAEFRSWFADYDGEVWDRQIESDSKAGKFDQLSAEALAEFERGETTKL